MKAGMRALKMGLSLMGGLSLAAGLLLPACAMGEPDDQVPAAARAADASQSGCRLRIVRLDRTRSIQPGEAMPPHRALLNLSGCKGEFAMEGAVEDEGRFLVSPGASMKIESRKIGSAPAANPWSPAPTGMGEGLGPNVSYRVRGFAQHRLWADVYVILPDIQAREFRFVLTVKSAAMKEVVYSEAFRVPAE